MVPTRYLVWTLAFLLTSTRACYGAFCPSTPFLSTKPRNARVDPLSAVEKENANKEDNGSFFFTVADEAVQQQQAETSTSAVPAPPKGPKGELVKTEFYLDLLEAIWTVGTDIARDAFFALRRTAANALTASLPEDERQELLERTMGKERVRAARQQQQADNDYAQSMSVQENVAAARAKEVQRDAKQWQKEKDAIYQQAEQAARERVETELAIQKARMDKERQQMAQQATAAQEQLQREKEKWQALQTEIATEKETLLTQQQAEQEESVAAVKEQEAKLATMEQALKQKEEQAKQDQLKIEQLEEQLEAQAEDATPRGTRSADSNKPRIHAGRYTPDEWRSLTDDEKEQVKALREELGPAAFNDWDRTTAGDVHPILGPAVQDLGYKRIHIVSVGKLGTIPIWKKQRIYRHERAKAMVEDKWRSMSLGLPGVICLHEGEDGKLAIIDGQHRVGMMILLRNKQRKYLQDHPDDTTFQPIDFDRVMVEVYPSGDTDVDKHAQDMFLEINKAEPVKLIDMPGVASAKDRQIITQAVEKLYEAYPAMFSPSQRCRVPNVNVDNLRNALFGSGCLKTHKLTTTLKLYDWILEQNALVGDKYIDSKEAQSSINPRAWKKARENKFYLGLESSWLYN